jgi:hypothetical protein
MTISFEMPQDIEQQLRNDGVDPGERKGDRERKGDIP